MLRRTTLLSGVVLLGALVATQVQLPGVAQDATAPAAPAAAGAGAAAPTDTAATGTTAATPTPDSIPRSEMIHRTLYAIYDKQDNHDLAAAELEELIRMKPADPVFPFAYGQLLMKDSKWVEAQARFEVATKLDPAFSNAYCGIGDCLFKQKKYGDAVEAYTKASRNAKAGQDYKAKVAIAKQWQERKQEEEDYAKALQKLGGGAKPAGTKPGVKKK